MSERTGIARGHVAPGFELVRDAFERNFSERGEIGAMAVSVAAKQPSIQSTPRCAA